MRWHGWQRVSGEEGEADFAKSAFMVEIVQSRSEVYRMNEQEDSAPPMAATGTFALPIPTELLRPSSQRSWLQRGWKSRPAN